jgi:hypothetical protein
LRDTLARVADVVRSRVDERALTGRRRSHVRELVGREGDRGGIDGRDREEREDEEPDDDHLADQSGFVATKIHPRILLTMAFLRSSTSPTRRISAEIKNTSTPTATPVPT